MHQKEIGLKTVRVTPASNILNDGIHPNQFLDLPLNALWVGFIQSQLVRGISNQFAMGLAHPSMGLSIIFSGI